MTVLTDIIDIVISRETTAVSRAAFNIPMFLATHTAFSERAREYTSITAVAADFSSTSNVYKAASAFFGQTIKPPKIVVGRRQVDGVDGSIATVANSTLYTVTINGTVFSFTSDASATATEIVAGLKAAYDAAPISGITFVNNLDGTFDLDISPAGTAWSVKASSNITLTNETPTETYVAALAAVELVNNNWYALTCDSHVQADVEALAAAVEARKKIYGTSTQDTAVKTTGTTDVAAVLNAAGYQRTFVLYSAEANSKFPECAWIGGQLPEAPGSNTWKFKTLAGITFDTLTDTESTNIKNKKANTYERIGGVNITTEGTMSGGEFVDVMIFVDWLEARMRERIFFRLVNTKKIPYTKSGTTIIENEIRAVLAEGIAIGGLSDNPRPTVSMPDVLTTDPNLRATRTYGDIVFTGRLQGAIHFIDIRGTVSV